MHTDDSQTSSLWWIYEANKDSETYVASALANYKVQLVVLPSIKNNYNNHNHNSTVLKKS